MLASCSTRSFGRSSSSFFAMSADGLVQISEARREVARRRRRVELGRVSVVRGHGLRLGKSRRDVGVVPPKMPDMRLPRSASWEDSRLKPAARSDSLRARAGDLGLVGHLRVRGERLARRV